MQEKLRELRERLRYFIDRIFAREFAGQLILFFALLTVVTAIGMTATLFGLFSPENANVPGIPRKIDQGFWDSMWWSLNHVLRLRGVEKMYGASGPILGYALFLSVMGLAVFGVLLSLINNTMRSRIEALRKGDTAVRERGHVLVLGWNNKIFTVLQQLARLEPLRKVVILAPLEIEEMQEKLRVFGIQRERITVILRSGMPSNRGELERVAVDRTTSVIMLATDNDDSEALKTMVLLAAKQNWPGQPPILISEIALEQNNELARIAARDKVHIISSSRVISKVIVQTIRNPGLAAVYSELFSPEGNGIRVQRLQECADHSLREIAYGFTDAIPIGIAWEEERDGTKRHSAGLNPEPDYEIAEDEQLVLISRSSSFGYNAPDKAHESSVYQQGLSETRVPSRVLLIGWTEILFDILVELDAHAVRGTEVIILSGTAPEEAIQQVNASLGRTLKNLSLGYRQGDAINREVYTNLTLTSFQSVVVLADVSAGKGDVDTRTLRILLRLSDLRKQDEVTAHTVVELLDETNRELFVGLGVDDIIVSSEVVSAQLAQISRQQILGPIYRELLSAGGVEISLRPVGDYVALDTDCRFEDLIYAAQQKMEIALGLRLNHKGGKALLNPARQKIWRLDEKDQVVVMAQQLYR